jgi:mono/diheme cytochrome c family protein
MVRKILKWTGIILLVLIAGVSLTTISRQHLKYEAPYPNIKASTDSAVIARGKHLVTGPAHCVDCHSPVHNKDSILQLGQDIPLVGGTKFDLPFGQFYTRNLTPDKETGIGDMTDAEIARVLRYSVKKNGEAVLPFMPFQNMSDEDLTSIISYLRSLKPVHNPVPDHSYNVVGNLIKAFLIKPVAPTERIAVAVPEDTTANYGRHMVMAVANCNECHTKRDAIGAYVGEPLAGGTEFEEKGKPTLISPNLTPDPTSRIFGWSQEAFIQRFRLSRTIPYSHMPWESFRRMSDTELKAIYNYLQTIKPVKTEVAKNSFIGR